MVLSLITYARNSALCVKLNQKIAVLYLHHLPVQETGTRSTNSTNTPALSASMTLFLQKQGFLSFFLSLLVVSGCLALIFFPLTLIRGSGWTDYLPVDWDADCVNFKATYSLQHPQWVSLTVSCSAVSSKTWRNRLHLASLMSPSDILLIKQAYMHNQVIFS